MVDVHMADYIFVVFLANVVFLVVLLLLCRYGVFDWWFKARAERKRKEKERREAELKEMMKEEMLVFDKDFLKRWR